MARRLLVSGLVLASCASTPEDAPYQSGSRLRAEFLEGGGGARIFNQFRDTELDTGCVFSRAADGRMRCLPSRTSSGFADPSCREPVVVDGCGPPPFVTEPAQPVLDEPCAPWRSSVHEVREPVATTNLYDFEFGECVLRRPLDPGETAYAIGLAVAPERFVSGAITYDRHGEFFDLASVRGEDGSRSAWGQRDAIRQEHCAIENLNGDDERWCFPWNRASFSFFPTVFSDSQCTTGVSYQVGGACGPPPQIGFAHSIDLDDPNAEVEVSLFSPGEAIFPDRLYEFGPPCARASAETIAAGPYYAIGAALDPNEFSRVLSRRAGEGRLQTTLYESEDGFWLATRWRFFDALLDTECYPRHFALAGDGEYRCIPTTAILVLASDPFLHADPECTTRVLQSPSADALVLRYGPSTCPYQAEELTTLGDPHEGPVYVRGETGECAVSPDVPTSGHYLVNELSLDPNSFGLVRVE